MNIKCETKKMKDKDADKSPTPSSAERKKSVKLGKSPTKKSADFLNNNNSEGSPNQKNINKDINDVVTSKLPHIVSKYYFTIHFCLFLAGTRSSFI